MVLDTAQNLFAAEAVTPLYTHCRRFWYKFEAQGDPRRSANLHEQLMRAIAQGDEAHATTASDALIDYLETFTRSVLERA
jgi:DNA-binding FadR family transcriptional regulator